MARNANEVKGEQLGGIYPAINSHSELETLQNAPRDAYKGTFKIKKKTKGGDNAH